MTEDEVRHLLGTLEGVRAVVGSKNAGTPESHWGDTFFFYDPASTVDQRMPFATIVTHDTDGWDEVSDLDRPGSFRVSLAVGRAHQPHVEGDIDYRTEDVILPHPQYAAQGWIAIVNPGPATSGQLAELARIAHTQAVRRHR